MKRIVSVSIGSSLRDHKAVVKILNEEFLIERIGTDGDIGKAIEIIKELDGKVDVFGMGGIDLFLHGKKNRRYVIKAALPIARAAKITPIVDGSGLKNTLERRVVRFIAEEFGIPLKDKKVLMVCAMDRFGMAEAFEKMGSCMTYGDLIFALGIAIPIRTLKQLHKLAAVLMPVISRLPFHMIYPTGKQQEININKYEKYYNEADIIAGDYLYIKKFLPENMKGKIIVTNTVTLEDVQVLKERGCRMLVTSTPELNGRSFGTNVMEAVLVGLIGKRPEEITANLYEELLDQSGFKHRVEILNDF